MKNRITRNVGMHRITTLPWTAALWALINVWKFSNICINRIGFTQFPQNIKAAAPL